jgi:hypothetical protein
LLLAPARVMCYYRLRGRHVGSQRQAQVGTGRQRQAGRQRQVGRHARRQRQAGRQAGTQQRQAGRQAGTHRHTGRQAGKGWQARRAPTRNPREPSATVGCLTYKIASGIGR